MTTRELADAELEITVLSPLEPLDDVRNILIGVHGLYLVKGPNSGIFLPQVPVEQGWTSQPTWSSCASRRACPGTHGGTGRAVVDLFR